MKVTDIASYKDGGTTLIETDEGRFWIDKHRTKIFKGDGYFQGMALEVIETREVIELLDAIVYHAEVYHRIKRYFKSE